MGIREEFAWKKLWCDEVRTERFFVFQWRLPGIVYLLYRLVVAVYTLTWLIIFASRDQSNAVTASVVLQVWGAYLTNWTYILLTIYFLYHALIVIMAHIVCCGSALMLTSRITPEQHKHLFHELEVTGNGYHRIEDEQPPEVMFELSTRTPFYLSILWILFEGVSVAAILVSLGFWLFLAPLIGDNLGDNENLQLHLFNTVLILIEHAVTAVPIRLLHIIYPFIYLIIYVIFSIIYWAEDHSHVMYPFLDWAKWSTAGYILLLGFVVVPLIHLMTYGFFRLKLKILSRL